MGNHTPPIIDPHSYITTRVITPTIITSFDAIDSEESGGSGGPCYCVPPDGDISVGPNHVIVAVNQAFQVYDKSGHPLTQPIGFDTFFDGCGMSGLTSSDAITAYDPVADRFTVGILRYTDSNGPSWVSLAASRSGDPTTSYNQYCFRQDYIGQQALYDFPHISVGQSALLTTGNLFPPGGAQQVSARVNAYDKQAMYQGAITATQVYTDVFFNSDFTQADTLRPALFNVGLPTNINYFINSSPPPSTRVTLWRWTDPFGANQFVQAGGVDVSPFVQAVPMLQPPPGQPMPPAGFIDTRTLGAMWHNNTLYATHTIGCNPGLGVTDCVQWYQVGSLDDTPTLIQEGIVSGNNESRAYPNLAIDLYGNVRLAYAYSSLTEPLGLRHVSRVITDPQYMMGPEAVIKAGEQIETGFNALRWGDFSGSVTDPDGLTLWHLEEYSKADENLFGAWGTWASAARIPFTPLTPVPTWTVAPTFTAQPPQPSSTPGGPTRTPTPTNLPTSGPSQTPGGPSRTPPPTPFWSPTLPPTPTPTACTTIYSISPGTGVVVPGIDDSAVHCDDCMRTVTLPFPFSIYNHSFSTASLGSNGTIGFDSNSNWSTNTCLPADGNPPYEYVIFPLWDDQTTAPAGKGIFTSVSGNAPNRIYNIEFRTGGLAVGGCAPGTDSNYEVRLYEGQSRFDVVYGIMGLNGSSATIGVQKNVFTYTQFSCYSPTVSSGMMLTFTLPTCGTLTPTVTPPPTQTPGGPTATPPPTATGTLPASATVTFTATPLATCQASWRLVPSPNLEGYSDNSLSSIAVVSVDDAWAVGAASNETTTVPVIQRWDGADWNIVNTPVLTASASLTGVWAGAPDDVWAVGSRSVQTQTTALTMHWNGAQWSVVASPSAVGVLRSVDGASANDVWAVGEGNIVHWDGINWTQVASPVAGDLYGISALASNDIWIAGNWFHNSRTETLTLHYDGSTWAVVPSANAGDANNRLSAVEAIAPNDVWAVGSHYDFPGSFTYSNLAIHWDGTQWTVVDTPSFSQWNSLVSVAAAAPDNVWAVGSSGARPGINTVALHWDGMEWGGPNSVTPASYSLLSGVAFLPNAEVWAVGVGANLDGTSDNIIEKYSSDFTDVPPGSTFYTFIRCLACRGIVNGYPDGTFKPNNNVTRGQLSKIVSNAAGFSDPQTTQLFEDVPPGSTFFDYIGRLASRGYINGYPCGSPGEPCNPPDNRPYFRPSNNATRGQISKIVSNAANFTDPPNGQTFEDVPPGSTFYDFIERLASRGVMSGYPCGSPNEPCVPPDNRPYFRPSNNATRGQTSKIVANTFFPNCQTPTRR
jgi:hypothetical protein